MLSGSMKPVVRHFSEGTSQKASVVVYLGLVLLVNIDEMEFFGSQKQERIT